MLVVPCYSLGAGAWLAAPLLAVIAAGGLFASRHELRNRIAVGWAGAAGLGIYLLYMAPVLAAGGWTWTGYNFVNDTAVQFVLADYLAHHGATMPGSPAQSTGLEHVRNSFATAYPLGMHALLASLDALVPAPLPAIFQPTIAASASLAGMALAALARRASLASPVAALVAFAAMAANLPYNYGLQGNAKEIAMITALAASAALARETLTSRAPLACVACLGVCLGASISLFSAAAVPFAGAMAVALLAASLVQQRSVLRARMIPVATVVGVAVVAVAALPTLLRIVHFGEVVQATYGGEPGITKADPLGQLLRPLQLAQVGGEWLWGDYRQSPAGIHGTLTTILVVGVTALVATGAVTLLRRRETGPLIALFASAVTVAVLEPRVTPYATAKMLALLSPAVVLVAGFGAAALARLRRPLGAVAYPAAAVLLAGILVSDSYSYRSTRLAPVDRLEALADASKHVPAARLYLVDDFEEFAKYFARGRQNVATESVTPRPVVEKLLATWIPRHADVDQMPARYVSSFGWIVQRNGPDASRPGAAFERVYANRWYSVWQHKGGPRVVAHLPFQSLDSRGEKAACGRVREFAARARAGDLVVAGAVPLVVMLPMRDAARGVWGPSGRAPDTVAPGRAGTVTRELRFPSGRYRVWVRGSLGRAVQLSVDGRRVGSARGVNTPASGCPRAKSGWSAGPTR